MPNSTIHTHSYKHFFSTPKCFLFNIHIHSHSDGYIGEQLGVQYFAQGYLHTCTQTRAARDQITNLLISRWPRPADICTWWPLMPSHHPQSTPCEALIFLNWLFLAVLSRLQLFLLLMHVSLQVNCPLKYFNSALSENSQSFQLRLSVVYSVCGGCWWWTSGQSSSQQSSCWSWLRGLKQTQRNTVFITCE